MKKIISLLFAAALLGACSPDNSADDTITQKEEAAIEEEEEVSETAATDEELAPVSESDLAQAELITDLSNYEEFEEQNAFDPSQFDTYLVEDSAAMRIISFLEDDEQVYKTIFIKEDNRFKVIDLKTEELLSNTPL